MIISEILLYVPDKSPKIPHRIRSISFQNIQRSGPKLSGHRTHMFIRAGKAIPSADRQKAPNNEIKRPSRGIATANKTEKRFNYIIHLQFFCFIIYLQVSNTKAILKPYSHQILLLLFSSFCTMYVVHKDSTGT